MSIMLVPGRKYLGMYEPESFYHHTMCCFSLVLNRTQEVFPSILMKELFTEAGSELLLYSVIM